MKQPNSYTDKFIRALQKECDSKKTKLHLLDTWPMIGGQKCSGLFTTEDGGTGAIQVKLTKNNTWLPILVHESCHMDQWYENCKEWKATMLSPDIDATIIIDYWLQGHVDLNKSQSTKVFDSVINMELDCEMRSVNKIIKYKLPIDITEYVKKANSYIYFYRVMQKERKWYNGSKKPYNLKNVWSEFPSHFDNDYNKISKRYYKLIKDNCL